MNSKNPHLLLFFPLIVLYSFLTLYGQAHAAPFTIAPRVIDRDVEPRDIIEEKIILSNTIEGKITLFPSVNNVTVGLEGGIEEFVAPSMSDRSSSLSSWLEIGRSGVELAPGETKEIPLIIRVAPNAEPGEYHAIIAYAAGTTGDEALALIKSGAVPTVLINVTIADKRSESATLSGFIVKKFITSFRVGDMSYRMQNSGDLELTPFGDVLIYNQRGEEVASVPVNPERQSVKPGDTATFSSAVPVDGLLGKYKAFLTLRYGDNQAAVYDTVFFYVFPWKKVAIGFAIFLALALALALWLHRRIDSSNDDFDDAEPVSVSVRSSVSGAHQKDIVMK